VKKPTIFCPHVFVQVASGIGLGLRREIDRKITNPDI